MISSEMVGNRRPRCLQIMQ